MSGLAKTARNITSNWGLLALSIAISFFMSPFIVNKLGSVYYGIWAIALQFTGYLFLLDLGVRESVIRYTSKYVARKRGASLNRILSTALLLYIPITAVCVVLTIVCAWGLPAWFDIDEADAAEARLAVIFAGLTIAQTFIFNIFTGVLQGLHRFDVSNSIGFVLTLLRAALIVITLNAGYKLAALAGIQFSIGFIGGLAQAVMAGRLLRRSGLPLQFHLPAKRSLLALSRKVFGYGFYVLLNNIAQKINFASDAVIIGLFLGVSAVTPFAIAGSLIDYLRTFIISTAQVFNPLSSQLHTQRRKEELGEMLTRASKLAVTLAAPVAITYAVLGDIFVGLWMGPEFMADAGRVLLILGVAQIISAPHYVVSSVLYGMSQHHTIGWLRAGEAVVKLGLSVVLVKQMGIAGVALGTVIPHAVLVLALLPALVSRKLSLSPLRYVLAIYARPAIAMAAAFFCAIGIRHYWQATDLLTFFVQVGVICSVYAAFAYWTALNAEERRLLARLIPGTRG